MIWLRSLIFNVIFYLFTAICCFLFLPALLFPRPLFLKTLSLYFHALHFLEKILIGLDYEVRGRENLPKEGSYIVAAKHYSTYETLKLPILFDDVAVILKRELMWIPLWGWLAAKARMVPVNRSSREQAIKSINSGAVRIKQEGRPIVIFPQGTRVKLEAATREKPYKHGAAHMAKKTDLPIIPLAHNSAVFWPRKSFLKKPGKVIFEFGRPTIPDGPPKEITKKLELELETACDRLVNEALQITR